MSIGNISLNDPMLNFFKAVDAARQRNTVAFNQMQSAAKLETPSSERNKKATTLNASYQPYRNKATGVNNAIAEGSIQTTKQVRTKILGGYFDAYA